MHFEKYRDIIASGMDFGSNPNISIYTMYKDVYPFQIIDFDNKNTTVAEFPTLRNKKSIVYFAGPAEIKTKNKIIVVPYCDWGLIIKDVVEIENEMLEFAKDNGIKACEDNCIHIIKTIKKYVYHGFAII